MKKQILKSVMCLSLSAAMIFGEASMAMAAAPNGTTDAVTASETTTEQGTEVTVPTAEVKVPSTEVTTEVTVPSTEGTDESTETAVPSTEVTAPSTEVKVPSTEVTVPSTETAEAATEKAAEENPDSVVDAAGLKVVSFSTLEAVSGIVYDAEKGEISWNKVANATQYDVVITDASTNSEVKKISTSALNAEFKDGIEGKTYMVTITAFDKNEVYMAGTGISSEAIDSYTEKSNYAVAYKSQADGTYTVYNFPMGAAGVASIQVPVKPDFETTKSTVSAITFKEIADTKMVFEIVNAPKLLEGERFEWQYSNNLSFKNDNTQGLYMSQTGGDNDGTVLSVYLNKFVPGEVCYVRVRVYSDKFVPAVDRSQYPDDSQYRAACRAQKMSAFTPIITYTIPEASINTVYTVVSGKSVTLVPELESGAVTGYQFAKKVGKNWVELSKQVGTTYKDSGLEANTTYKYRVRGYSYNKLTGKTKYTGWKYVNAATWGSSLKLKAAAASSTSVKLSWNKVSSAKGYEIYRYETSSLGQNMSEGQWNDFFDSYKLIKTITKSTTTSYTDKKLTSGNSYKYIVRAYREVGKEKSYIQDEVSITLNASGFQVQTQYYTSTGSYKVTWNKMTGIKGYYVEKFNAATKKYDVVKKLSKTSASYTFAKVAAGSVDVQYRIRPYTSSKKVKGGDIFTVSAKLGTVKNVKASATADGIQVTWSPVAGADFYQVYRTTATDYRYDKTTKTYNYYNATLVSEANVEVNGYHPELGEDCAGDSQYNVYAGTYKNSDIKGTSVIDRTVTYTKPVLDSNGSTIPVRDAAGKFMTTVDGKAYVQTETAEFYEGPEKGVTYNYYVIAYAKAPNGQSTSDSCMSASPSKASAAMYTSVTAKKVSKISSVKSKKTGEATISYKKASGASGYAIYRATSKKGTYVLVGTTTKTSYTDAGLKSGKTYYYKVASYKQSEAKANIYSAKTSYKSVKAK